MELEFVQERARAGKGIGRGQRDAQPLWEARAQRFRFDSRHDGGEYTIFRIQKPEDRQAELQRARFSFLIGLF
jgi:hypothetical protein